MNPTDYAALGSLLLNFILGWMTWQNSQKKDKISAENDLRDDLFQLIDQQNKKIDAQNGQIEKQNAQIDELKDQRVRIREEFNKVIKDTGIEVSNWRETYYMTLDQYQRLKLENMAVKRELEDLRKSYEKLLAEYTRIAQNPS